MTPAFSNLPQQISSLSLDSDDTIFAILQPTPIDPNRVFPVEHVPIYATSWNHLDNLCYDSLQKLAFDSMTAKNMIRRDSNVSIVSLGSAEESSSSFSFHKSQVDLWNLRYEELVAFQKEHKHCLVPLKNYGNPSLSHWVKRQRYQYRVKQEGQHSTLNDERQAALEKLGFVWDSHAASWEERWNDLCIFHEIHGHSNVPKTYKTNPQLAIWVKGQRRQFKLYTQGKSSAMSTDRIEKLLHLGFVFDPRSRR